MRIGIRLGGAMFGVIVTMMGTMARADSAERVVAIPLGGSLEAQKGDHHYGVYVPTRFGGELTISADDIARRLGTISYEVVCGIVPRAPRR